MSPTARGNDEIARIAREMCNGRPDAAEWFLSMLDLSNLWDHVHDGDEIDRQAADQTLLAVTTEWGLNEFYRQNSAILSVFSLTTFAAWQSSNLDPTLRAKAFDVATELGTAVAFLVGGPDHALKFTGSLRAWAKSKMMENDSKG